MAMRELVLSDDLGTEISGLDALELPISSAPGRASRLWAASWPKLTAFGLFILAWQAVVWSHLKPDYVLPGPGPVFQRLFHDIGDGTLARATATTMQRGGLRHPLCAGGGRA